jgi:hypothetical protein
VVTQPREDVRIGHDLKRYVLPTETVVLATRRHWASLLEPAATCTGAFLLVAVIVFAAPSGLQDVVGWLWFGWLFTLGRLAFRWLEWRHEWFVSTDKRLLLLYGLVIHKVAMMPLIKVTDMGYTRTPLGQLLGYGRFVMESAGQDQALRQIDYVPRPDATYRALCAEIFRPAASGPGSGGRGANPGSPTFAADPAPAPVVVVRGRDALESSRPTTQPIAIPGRPETARTDLPAQFPPNDGVRGRRDATPAPGPHWDPPHEWQPPRPYDPNPR